jgi:copper chaperone
MNIARETMETVTLNVPGMTCGHCESAVRGELTKVAGVADVQVDLASKNVRIVGTRLERDVLVAAIDEAGFEVA